LDGLDDIDKNVSFTQAQDGSVRFDATMARKLAGKGKIDIDAFDGKLSVRGEVITLLMQKSI
jgi:hypothetical protein